MEVERYHIEGLISFVPRRFEDERGVFYESFNLQRFEEMIGQSVQFVQDNVSHSKKNVVRGLHFQIPPHAQGKLIRVSQGRVLDVAVDLRTSSPTYGKHVMVELDSETGRIFWIPEGFAHGFIALEDNTIFNYKCTDYYHPECEDALLWNDEVLNINWETQGAILSAKDAEAKSFSDYQSPFK